MKALATMEAMDDWQKRSFSALEPGMTVGGSIPRDPGGQAVADDPEALLEGALSVIDTMAN